MCTVRGVNDRITGNSEMENGALFPPNKARPVTSKKPRLASNQRQKLDFAPKNAILSHKWVLVFNRLS